MCLVAFLVVSSIAKDADDCVIGTGTAGSNLAKRLSDISDRSVTAFDQSEDQSSIVDGHGIIFS